MTVPFDPQETITALEQFLKRYLADSGHSGFVVGLSGGIDSAVATALAVGAVGCDNVLAVLMPYRSSSPDSTTDAMKVVEQLGVDHKLVDISPMIDAYYGRIDESMRIRAGNKMARERMSVLFDLAHETGRLVLGTGNRTEICLGYTTWYGDSACSVAPLGELYKSQVRCLAGLLHTPESIIVKPPSADLWTDQTDEGEIGVSYEEIDTILQKIVDEDIKSLSTLEKAGLNPQHVGQVIALMNRNAFKRTTPPIASLGRPSIPERIALTD